MTGLAFDRSGPAGTLVVLLRAGITGRTMRDPQWQGLTRERDVLRLDLCQVAKASWRPAGP